MRMVRILIIESDPYRLMGMAAAVSHETNFHLLGTGVGISEALSAARGASPDILIINLNQWSTIRGFALMRWILRAPTLIALYDHLTKL